MSDTRDLLIEIGTEELPPNALAMLAEVFSRRISDYLLDASGLRAESGTDVEYYYSPRRLAVILKRLKTRQDDQTVERYGPASKIAFDNEGRPTRAAEGFAQSCGITLDEVKEKDGKLFYSGIEAGKQAARIIPEAINQVLSKLPVPRRMRWGSHPDEFVRPVHWVVVLFGKDVIDCEVLGVKSGRLSYGHRFHHPQAIKLKSPRDYVTALKKAKVWLNGAEHELQSEISRQARQCATKLNGEPLNNDPESALVTEIAALVEWPKALAGSFDPGFLALPEEVLIATLEGQQRYFPLRDRNTGKLLPHFITITNIESRDESRIREGNERVIVPRLTDAMFFWDTDRKQSLEDRLPALDGIIFQKKLGSMGDKTRRCMTLATKIAGMLDADKTKARRAAQLAKCDLVTELVGEFPELQGITGRYLATHDGEADDVATAIEEHYLPRFAGDRLPETATGQAVALADKLDTLAGIFGIGQPPTGEKDPFALRRAALGIVRILVEKKLSLPLHELVNLAYENHKPDLGQAHTDLETFIFERARGYFQEKGYTTNEVEAVFCLRPVRLDMVSAQLEAVKNYNLLPEAPNLSTANKRIANILKNLESIPSDYDDSLFTDQEEKQLAREFERIEPEIDKLFRQQDFTKLLQQLAILKDPVDTFFDKVLVMTEDEKIRDNRIGLLHKLYKMMNRIADLSKLAA